MAGVRGRWIMETPKYPSIHSKYQLWKHQNTPAYTQNINYGDTKIPQHTLKIPVLKLSKSNTVTYTEEEHAAADDKTGKRT